MLYSSKNRDQVIQVIKVYDVEINSSQIIGLIGEFD
jgi:hypothetical protein